MTTRNVDEIVTKVVSSNYKASHDKPRKSYTDDEKLEMDLLFSLLKLEYPRFYNMDTDQGKKDTARKRTMWIKLLRPYSKEARGKATENTLKTIHNKGGPTVGQFISLCKTPAAHKRLVQPALPAPSNLDKGTAAVKAILKHLKG